MSAGDALDRGYVSADGGMLQRGPTLPTEFRALAVFGPASPASDRHDPLLETLFYVADRLWFELPHRLCAVGAIR